MVHQRKLTDAERTTLLVAGAAAGMSATFAVPMAAILLAVELLLFEWRPRSLVPDAVASVMAPSIARVRRRSARYVRVVEVTPELQATLDGGVVADASNKTSGILAYSDETCRAVAEEMATTGVTSMPVVNRETWMVCGSITAQELLTGRRRVVVRESERTR